MGFLKKAVIFALIAVGLYFLKQYNQGPMCESDTRLDGKVIIITGANTGKGALIFYKERGDCLYL